MQRAVEVHFSHHGEKVLDTAVTAAPQRVLTLLRRWPKHLYDLGRSRTGCSSTSYCLREDGNLGVYKSFGMSICFFRRHGQFVNISRNCSIFLQYFLENLLEFVQISQ